MTFAPLLGRQLAGLGRDLAAELRAGSDGIAYRLRLVLIGGTVLLFGIGGWATFAPLSGAVIAAATVVVDGNDKKIQHQTGGIVASLQVKDGDHVQAGDVLLRLDETVTRANQQIVAKQLDQGLMREARLKAERDGAAAVAVPEALAARAAAPAVRETIDEEQRLFLSRRAARDGLKSQLNERIVQLSEEIRGLEAQQAANDQQAALIINELKSVRDLYAKNLVPLTRLSSIERESARLAGEKGQLIASAAQSRGKIAETKLQILQVDQDLRTEVGKDLRETQAKDAELVERKVAADDQLQRLEIRSPQAGFVHQLAVHTIGGVVAPGEPIMIIVPQGEELVLEAKIAPQDIDRVSLGQPAVVRLSAFDQRTTPEIAGKVMFVSADSTREPQTNQAYYVARIALNEAQLRALPNIRLVPGMPAEAHLQTGERTALSYLLKPLRDQVSRAFKER